MFLQLAVEAGLFINCPEQCAQSEGDALILLSKIGSDKFLEKERAPVRHRALLNWDSKHGDPCASRPGDCGRGCKISQPAWAAAVDDLGQQVLVSLRRDGVFARTARPTRLDLVKVRPGEGNR